MSGPMPDVCVACQQDVSNNAYHGLHCKHTKQFATLRHNAVENALAAAARQSACAVVQQATGLASSAPGLKPDLLMLTSKGTVVSDVVVSDPMAPSNLPVSVKGSLALANQMAEKKRGKYKVITDALRAEHLPFCPSVWRQPVRWARLLKRSSSSSRGLPESMAHPGRRRRSKST